MTSLAAAPSPAFDAIRAELRANPRRWLVTGVAGFIGSALLEELLSLGQHVVGLDSFATGSRANLDDVLAGARPDAAARFRFIEGDIRDLATCEAAVDGADVVLHQAALGSVPRSINDPITSNAANVTGFLNMIEAARKARVGRFVYAASSSTYGDHPALPKVEPVIGRPLSPYAVTKYVNELYAEVFARCYGTQYVGLRYFNVFGRRQDPAGAYAAVIPRWTLNLLAGRPSYVNGDGETSRDFCYIDNVVQANLLAGAGPATEPSAVYNVACSRRTTLNELYAMLQAEVGKVNPAAREAVLEYRDFRAGDVRHSLADITRIGEALGYRPTHYVADGLELMVPWYAAQVAAGRFTAQGVA